MSKTETVRFRVSPTERELIYRAAGTSKVSEFIRSRVLSGLIPVETSSPTDEPPVSAEQGQAATASFPPARTWGQRVDQLKAQGLPLAHAQRVADEEWKSK